jgi:hypothetical protein
MTTATRTSTDDTVGDEHSRWAIIVAKNVLLD